MPFEHENLTHIGEMAIFYIPVKCFKEVPILEDTLHRWLILNYSGYTRAISPVKGFWTSGTDSKHIFEDENYEYKVSFKGKNLIPDFVKFLASICIVINEEALYLEMGEHSYLVTPKVRL